MIKEVRMALVIDDTANDSSPSALEGAGDALQPV
jgi:hypothetical protein